MNTGVIWDMHAHLACLTNEKYKKISYEVRKKIAQEELNNRRSQNIAAFFSCGTPQEWEFMQDVLQDRQNNPAETVYKKLQERINHKNDFLSFGVHPWYSDQYEPDIYREYFEQCDAVGEIGMDSVWCAVPLNRQKRVFEAQLQTAAEFKKPIILHTKGQEQEIIDMIRGFPQKICVHWYSGELNLLEKYLEKDCYFTLGPDFAWNAEDEWYQFIVKHVPEDRLFLETDGLDAVIWAYEQEKQRRDLLRDRERKNGDTDISSSWNLSWNLMKETKTWEMLGTLMYQNLSFLAACKKKSPKEMQMQLQKNLFRFLSA